MRPSIHSRLPSDFFSAGVDVCIDYLRVLLHSDHLFQNGCPCVPHGLTSLQYVAIFEGCVKPELFLATAPCKKKQILLEADAEVHSTTQTAGIAWRRIAKKVADLDSQRLRRFSAQHSHAPMKDKDVKLPEGEWETVAAALRVKKPLYFESQVGAMCGLHALNNICGSCVGSQTFTVQDVADALQTLEEEYKRDRLPWSIREHAQPSGDYSLALLSWMLQRRLVLKPSAQQFIASNLTNACTSEELMAEDLVGALVHIPSHRDPQVGHWVAFAKSRQAGSFWWMDSITGFHLMRLEGLQTALLGKNFVIALASADSIALNEQNFIVASYHPHASAMI